MYQPSTNADQRSLYVLGCLTRILAFIFMHMKVECLSISMHFTLIYDHHSSKLDLLDFISCLKWFDFGCRVSWQLHGHDFKDKLVNASRQKCQICPYTHDYEQVKFRLCNCTLINPIFGSWNFQCRFWVLIDSIAVSVWRESLGFLPIFAPRISGGDDVQQRHSNDRWKFRSHIAHVIYIFIVFIMVSEATRGRNEEVANIRKEWSISRLIDQFGLRCWTLTLKLTLILISWNYNSQSPIKHIIQIPTMCIGIFDYFNV